MNVPFQTFDLARFLSETPHKILSQIQSPAFLVQTGGVVIAGLVAASLARLTRKPMARAAERSLPKSWGPGFIRSVEYVAMPVFWLALLWAGALAGWGLGFKIPIVGAAIDLVFAWICIRLLSFTVRSHTTAIIISVAAWTIAALNILDLSGPLLTWLRGVTVYENRHQHISLLDAGNAAFVLIVLLWVTRLIYRMLHRQIEQAEALTPSLRVLLTQALQILLPSLAVIIALQTVGIDLTTLTVVFGAVGLGVGLGLQRVVANLVAGLTLLMGKNIKPGDIIEYKACYGWVTAMGAGYVTLRTRDGVEHLVPNDYFLTNGVENWSYSDGKLRVKVPVGISYDADPHLAMRLCVEAAKAAPRVIADPEPLCVLKEFGDSAIILEIRFWIDDPRNGITNAKSGVLLEVWDRFKAAGISIPYPQREVRIVAGAPATGV